MKVLANYHNLVGDKHWLIDFSCPNSVEWNVAIIKELEFMKVNQFWDLVDLPKQL